MKGQRISVWLIPIISTGNGSYRRDGKRKLYFAQKLLYSLKIELTSLTPDLEAPEQGQNTD